MVEWYYRIGRTTPRGMMSDDIDLLSGARIEWVFDRFSPQDVKPRHIGRIVTFFYTDDDRGEVNSSDAVTGTLDGVRGKTVIVSGDWYDFDYIENLKVWRRKLS